jgi:aminotransferase EvaB
MVVNGESVPVFDYRQGYAALRDEIDAAMRQVLESGSLILGPRVKAFEDNFCRFLGAPGHAVGVGNGTDALAIALRALGIGRGDDVITVPNTAIPTVSAIRMTGATPVFCDVDPHSAQMAPGRLENCLTPRTRAVVPVHLYGNAVDIDPVLEFAARRGLRVVEDCAQACGTRYNGRAVGTLGDAGCFSFYPTKNLGAYGDGGLCFTADAALAESMRRLRAYGCGQNYYAECEGVNSRLDELQAAILDVKLRHLPEYLARRRQIAALYRQQLSAAVQPMPITPGTEASYHLFVIRSANRAELIKTLQTHRIGFGIHYPTPLHLMRGYEHLGYRPGDFPHAERLAEEVLSLPCYPELTDAVLERVCVAVAGGTKQSPL